MSGILDRCTCTPNARVFMAEGQVYCTRCLSARSLLPLNLQVPSLGVLGLFYRPEEPLQWTLPGAFPTVECSPAGACWLSAIFPIARMTSGNLNFQQRMVRVAAELYRAGQMTPAVLKNLQVYERGCRWYPIVGPVPGVAVYANSLHVSDKPFPGATHVLTNLPLPQRPKPEDFCPFECAMADIYDIGHDAVMYVAGESVSWSPRGEEKGKFENVPEELKLVAERLYTSFPPHHVVNMLDFTFTPLGCGTSMRVDRMQGCLPAGTVPEGNCWWSLFSSLPFEAQCKEVRLASQLGYQTKHGVAGRYLQRRLQANGLRAVVDPTGPIVVQYFAVRGSWIRHLKLEGERDHPGFEDLLRIRIEPNTSPLTSKGERIFRFGIHKWYGAGKRARRARASAATAVAGRASSARELRQVEVHRGASAGKDEPVKYYSPPAEGNCGWHCLSAIANRMVHSKFETTLPERVRSPDDWATDEDLASTIQILRLPAALDRNGACVCAKYVLKLEGEHWTVSVIPGMSPSLLPLECVQGCCEHKGGSNSPSAVEVSGFDPACLDWLAKVMHLPSSVIPAALAEMSGNLGRSTPPVPVVWTVSQFFTRWSGGEPSDQVCLKKIVSLCQLLESCCCSQNKANPVTPEEVRGKIDQYLRGATSLEECLTRLEKARPPSVLDTSFDWDVVLPEVGAATQATKLPLTSQCHASVTVAAQTSSPEFQSRKVGSVRSLPENRPLPAPRRKVRSVCGSLAALDDNFPDSWEGLVSGPFHSPVPPESVAHSDEPVPIPAPRRTVFQLMPSPTASTPVPAPRRRLQQAGKMDQAVVTPACQDELLDLSASSQTEYEAHPLALPQSEDALTVGRRDAEEALSEAAGVPDDIRLTPASSSSSLSSVEITRPKYSAQAIIDVGGPCCGHLQEVKEKYLDVMRKACDATKLDDPATQEWLSRMWDRVDMLTWRNTSIFQAPFTLADKFKLLPSMILETPPPYPCGFVMMPRTPVPSVGAESDLTVGSVATEDVPRLLGKVRDVNSATDQALLAPFADELTDGQPAGEPWTQAPPTGAGGVDSVLDSGGPPELADPSPPNGAGANGVGPLHTVRTKTGKYFDQLSRRVFGIVSHLPVFFSRLFRPDGHYSPGDWGFAAFTLLCLLLCYSYPAFGVAPLVGVFSGTPRRVRMGVFGCWLAFAVNLFKPVSDPVGTACEFDSPECRDILRSFELLQPWDPVRSLVVGPVGLCFAVLGRLLGGARHVWLFLLRLGILSDCILAGAYVLSQGRCKKCWGSCVRTAPSEVPFNVFPFTRATRSSLVDLCNRFCAPKGMDPIFLATGWRGCWTGQSPIEQPSEKPPSRMPNWMKRRSRLGLWLLNPTTPIRLGSAYGFCRPVERWWRRLSLKRLRFPSSHFEPPFFPLERKLTPIAGLWSTLTLLQRPSGPAIPPQTSSLVLGILPNRMDSRSGRSPSPQEEAHTSQLPCMLLARWPCTCLPEFLSPRLAPVALVPTTHGAPTHLPSPVTGPAPFARPGCASPNMVLHYLRLRWLPGSACRKLLWLFRSLFPSVAWRTGRVARLMSFLFCLQSPAMFGNLSPGCFVCFLVCCAGSLCTPSPSCGWCLSGFLGICPRGSWPWCCWFLSGFEVVILASLVSSPPMTFIITPAAPAVLPPLPLLQMEPTWLPSAELRSLVVPCYSPRLRSGPSLRALSELKNPHGTLSMWSDPPWALAECSPLTGKSGAGQPHMSLRATQPGCPGSASINCLTLMEEGTSPWLTARTGKGLLPRPGSVRMGGLVAPIGRHPLASNPVSLEMGSPSALPRVAILDPQESPKPVSLSAFTQDQTNKEEASSHAPQASSVTGSPSSGASGVNSSLGLRSRSVMGNSAATESTMCTRCLQIFVPCLLPNPNWKEAFPQFNFCVCSSSCGEGWGMPGRPWLLWVFLSGMKFSRLSWSGVFSPSGCLRYLGSHHGLRKSRGSGFRRQPLTETNCLLVFSVLVQVGFFGDLAVTQGHPLQVVMNLSTYAFLPRMMVVTSPVPMIACGVVHLLAVILYLFKYRCLHHVLVGDGAFSSAFRWTQDCNRVSPLGVSQSCGMSHESLTGALAMRLTDDDLDFLTKWTDLKCFVSASNMRNAAGQFIEAAYAKALRVELAQLVQVDKVRGTLAKLEAFADTVAPQISPGDIVVALGHTPVGSIFDLKVGNTKHTLQAIETRVIAGSKMTVARVVDPTPVPPPVPVPIPLPSKVLESGPNAWGDEDRLNKKKRRKMEAVGIFVMDGKKYQKFWDKNSGDVFYEEVHGSTDEWECLRAGDLVDFDPETGIQCGHITIEDKVYSVFTSPSGRRFLVPANPENGRAQWEAARLSVEQALGMMNVDGELTAKDLEKLKRIIEKLQNLTKEQCLNC
nr:proteinase [Porcine reproductive and respiratory syndrome virus]